jgi:hypothetical protein
MLNNLCWLAFSIIGKISQQSKIQILKSSDFGGFQLLEVGEKKLSKFYIGFSVCIKIHIKVQ